MCSTRRLCLWMVRYVCVFCLLFLLFSCGGGSGGGSGGGGDGGGGNGDGVKVPISSEEANSALLKVINDPTDENFDDLMDTIADLDDSKASCLYKAAGELLAVYRSQPLSEIMDNFGLEVGIETNFDALTMQHNLSRITYDYLKKAVYITDAQSLLADLEERLSRADNLLAQAEGEDIVISLEEMNAVHFDTIDIQVMRSAVNLLKALVIYLQAVDFTVVDYTVSYGVKNYDIRLLCTDPDGDIRVPDDDIDDELMEEAWKDLIAKNPNLLTYRDRARLSAFRSALDAAIGHYKSAVTAIVGLSEEQRRQRYANAFSLDTELDLESARLIRDKVLPSVISCLDNPSAKVTSFETKETGFFEYIDGGDGFYYPMTEKDIEVQDYCFNSTAFNTRIYDLLNAGAARTPRHVLLEGWDLPEGTDFEPYVPCGAPEIITGVFHISWDEPEETFEIPLADITIDGDPDDWEGIEAFQTAGETVFKIARDLEGDVLYLCLQTGYEPSSGNEWHSRAWLSMQYGFPWYYYGMYYDSVGVDLFLEKYPGDSEMDYYALCYGYDTLTIIDPPTLFSGGDTGFEMSLNGFSRLVKKGSLNIVRVWCNGDSNGGSIKLLPEAEE